MSYLILIDAPAEERRDTGLDLICPEMNWSNMIALTSAADAAFPAYHGTLSIKYVIGGREVYESQGRTFPLNQGNYLILNHGQRYSSFIEEKQAIDSLGIFFRPGFAQGVLRDIVTPDDHLLDDPAKVVDAGEVRFAERLYRHDETVSPLLFRIHGMIRERKRPSRGWIEEQFHLLLPRMLEAHRGVLGELKRIPSLRLATRLEISQRLDLAVDFMHSGYSRRITLAEIARAAHLSPHHFLRLFKSLHGRTPLQYLTRLRLDRARDLLAGSSRSVLEVCLDVGFESPTSFSLLFRRHFGMSPTEFRAAGRTNRTMNDLP